MLFRVFLYSGKSTTSSICGAPGLLSKDNFVEAVSTKVINLDKQVKITYENNFAILLYV